MVGRYCSHLLPRQDGITYQIQVNWRFFQPDGSPRTASTRLRELLIYLLSLWETAAKRNANVPLLSFVSIQMAHDLTTSDDHGLSRSLDVVVVFGYFRIQSERTDEHPPLLSLLALRVCSARPLRQNLFSFQMQITTKRRRGRRECVALQKEGKKATLKCQLVG